MANKKKTSTKKTVAKKSDSANFDVQSLLQSPDSMKSLIYGAITVIVLAVVLVLGFRTLSQNRTPELTDTSVMTQDESNKYTVLEGETLWSIAEKEYNDGFKWTEIAEANNLVEPYVLEAGMELTIPALEEEDVESSEVAETTVAPEATTTQEQGKNEVAGQTYTVVEGDNLWTIAERAYNDGYKWVEIANANQLPNPDLIYVGTVLQLPR